MSERRACHLLAIARSTARYCSAPDQEAELIDAVAQIKDTYPRFGVRRVHALLKAQWQSKGQLLNHKRVQRIWYKSGWQVPQRPKKRKIVTGRTMSPLASHPNHVWSYDFQYYALVSGRKIRLLNILDELGFYWGHPRVAFGERGRVSDKPSCAGSIEAALLILWHSLLRSQRYAVMTSLAYNGPEFIAAEVREWLKQNGSSPHYPNKPHLDPGCPWQNGYVESFHGKLRDKQLDREVFASVQEARVQLETHRHWYNKERLHSSLKYLPPATFRQQWQTKKMDGLEERPPARPKHSLC